MSKSAKIIKVCVSCGTQYEVDVKDKNIPWCKESCKKAYKAKFAAFEKEARAEQGLPVEKPKKKKKVAKKKKK